jgi:hypothetical protein
MHASKPKQQVRFKADAARLIGEKRGLATDAELADYFGIKAPTFSRLINGVTVPGEVAIAAVLGSHPEDPDITWDGLFEIVEVTAV